jgi:hypothetical protein
MSFELSVTGIPVRVLVVNHETGESLIVFRDHMQSIPTRQLIQIMDPPKPEDIARLAHEFGFFGVRAADPSSLGRTGPDPFFKPLTVGDLYRKPEGR